MPIPGTFGSALGLGIVLATGRLHVPRLWLSALLGGLALFAFLVGVWASGRAEAFFASKDPGHVVIDEVVGQVVVFLLRPDAPWRWLLAGFLIFRILDVIKPFPARRAERLRGGWGIMTDDLVAGLHSLAAVLVLDFVIK